MDKGLLVMFIARPWLALLPAALFGLLYWKQRSAPALFAALAWLIYAGYEHGLKTGFLCPAGPNACDLRVDLLLIYPLLGLMSVFALIVAIRRARAGRSTQTTGAQP